LLFAFVLSIPSALFLAVRAGSLLDRSLSSLLFALYSTPAFWLGTLLIVFLGGGDFLNIFPPFGLGDISNMSFFDALIFRFRHLVLPVFCLFYPAYTYLTRQMRGAAIDEIHKPYVRALSARGIPSARIRNKHIFINASLPHITLLGSFVPLIISGSVMIEIIFSLPGMGKTTLDALYARDYPVVFGAVLITSVFTVLGFLLSDILYHLADPRIRVKKEEA
jgi:ABC-type dipeptide/oligopeptide/nickel transport system permease component